MKTKVIVVMILTMLGSNFVNANELYLDQSGDGTTIDLLQEGSDNKIGTSEQSAFTLNGNSQTVDIKQQGSSNTLTGSITGDSVGVTNYVTGSSNVQSINCTDCSGATINNTITGDNNTTTQSLGAGQNQFSKITITGDANAVTHTATDADHKADITVTSLSGNALTNTINVTQSGVAQQQAIVNASGSGITLNITQKP